MGMADEARGLGRGEQAEAVKEETDRRARIAAARKIYDTEVAEFVIAAAELGIVPDGRRTKSWRVRLAGSSAGGGVSESRTILQISPNGTWKLLVELNERDRWVERPAPAGWPDIRLDREGYGSGLSSSLHSTLTEWLGKNMRG